MERRDVPTAWIGQWVRTRIKTRRGGGEYLVLAELADINDEGIRLFNSKALTTKAGSSEIARAHPWSSLIDVEPAKVKWHLCTTRRG